MICKVEEDSSCHVFFLVFYTYLHGATFNKCVCSDDALRGRAYKQLTLISVDKQPCIKNLHVEVNVILFARKRVNPKDVTGH